MSEHYECRGMRTGAEIISSFSAFCVVAALICSCSALMAQDIMCKSKAALAQELTKKNIESVCLYGKAGDDAVLMLKKIPKLSELILPSSKVTDHGLIVLRSLPNLTRFSAPWGISDRGMKEIGNAKTLEILELAQCKNITDAGLAHLAPLKKLKRLDLSGTPVTDVGMTHLSKLALEEVFLRHVGITDVGLSKINVSKLRVLYLVRTRVSDAGLVALSSAKKLIELDLSNTAVSGKGLQHLSELPLIALVLRETSCTDQSVKAVVLPKSLITLDISKTKICDIRRLAGLKKLKYLYTHQTKISPASIAQHLKHLPLKELTVDSKMVGSDGAKKLKQAFPKTEVTIVYADQ